MHGISGLLPLGEVTAGIAAVRRSDGQRVIIVDVATGAGHVGVAIGQQETRGAVIEGGGGPGSCIVAL